MASTLEEDNKKPAWGECEESERPTFYWLKHEWVKNFEKRAPGELTAKWQPD